MVFLAILSVISFALLSPCLSQNQLKCSVLNVLGDKQLVRFGTSWISTEIHGNTNSFNGTKDRELNLCDRSQKGPAVNSATLQAFKTVPDISKLDDGTFYYYNYTRDCFRTYDVRANPWGINHLNAPLARYTSAGAWDLPLGTTLVIEELKNVLLPNATQKHNGCVKVDHICRECVYYGCNFLEVYIGYRNNLLGSNLFLNNGMGIWNGNNVSPNGWPYSVTVTNTECDVLSYD